ncbi:hypothetical protein TNCV_1369751 [Trichonephila clavipes]|nr:hypothetical protein TNCV_1369751 [Trichonephila clavipes]
MVLAGIPLSSLHVLHGKTVSAVKYLNAVGDKFILMDDMISVSKVLGMLLNVYTLRIRIFIRTKHGQLDLRKFDGISLEPPQQTGGLYAFSSPPSLVNSSVRQYN